MSVNSGGSNSQNDGFAPIDWPKDTALIEPLPSDLQLRQPGGLPPAASHDQNERAPIDQSDDPDVLAAEAWFTDLHRAARASSAGSLPPQDIPQGKPDEVLARPDDPTHLDTPGDSGIADQVPATTGSATSGQYPTDRQSWRDAVRKLANEQSRELYADLLGIADLPVPPDHLLPATVTGGSNPPASPSTVHPTTQRQPDELTPGEVRATVPIPSAPASLQLRPKTNPSPPQIPPSTSRAGAHGGAPVPSVSLPPPSRAPDPLGEIGSLERLLRLSRPRYADESPTVVADSPPAPENGGIVAPGTANSTPTPGDEVPRDTSDLSDEEKAEAELYEIRDEYRETGRHWAQLILDTSGSTLYAPPLPLAALHGRGGSYSTLRYLPHNPEGQQDVVDNEENILFDEPMIKDLVSRIRQDVRDSRGVPTSDIFLLGPEITDERTGEIIAREYLYMLWREDASDPATPVVWPFTIPGDQIAAFENDLRPDVLHEMFTHTFGDLTLAAEGRLRIRHTGQVAYLNAAPYTSHSADELDKRLKPIFPIEVTQYTFRPATPRGAENDSR